jgi:putative phosphoribosyl transferase
MQFQDRRDAGQRLAEALAFLKGQKNVLVLGIPRGGVVVAAEVARALRAPLDVLIARKIGAPGNPELAIGAVASSGEVVLDERLVAGMGVPADYIEAETARQRQEIARRMAAYRGDFPSTGLRRAQSSRSGRRPPSDVAGKTVILVDDGVATGATTLAALRALRAAGPAELILAVPVGPPDAIARLSTEADRVICLHTPAWFWAVGAFYMDFSQTTDEEVVRLLKET